MPDQASTPDSPIEPTGVQLQASDVNDSSSQPPQFQTSTSNGKTLDESLAKYGAPGSSWTSKKFMEEYDLAVQKLCHQEFDPGMLSCLERVERRKGVRLRLMVM